MSRGTVETLVGSDIEVGRQRRQGTSRRDWSVHRRAVSELVSSDVEGGLVGETGQ
jgi:hypothetical protein